MGVDDRSDLGRAKRFSGCNRKGEGTDLEVGFTALGSAFEGEGVEAGVLGGTDIDTVSLGMAGDDDAENGFRRLRLVLRRRGEE